MKPDLRELGMRAVESKWWRWMPGMCVFGASVQPHGIVGKIRLTELHDKPTQLRDPWPDLSDPATLGCALQLVRERWQLPLRSPEHWPADGAEPEYWSMEMYNEYICGDTEAEVLVAALEEDEP